jgi:acetyltransferase
MDGRDACDAASWTTSSVLRDGTRITIRLLDPATDRQREIDFLNSLSERTRYLRLLTPLKYLPKHMFDQLMDVDGQRRVAFVATVGEGDEERFVGVARYGVTDDPESAEVGITVTDAWQGRGVATRLMQRLEDYARAHGIKTLTGIVLPDNAQMLDLARRMGFQLKLSSAERLMKITKPLA